MSFRAGETNNFSLFLVENGQILSVLWLSVRFHVEIPVICVNNELFLQFMYVFN